MQEGLAVEPLLLGCGVKPHDLKRLKYQSKQINHGCLDKSISFDLAFALIPTFARLLKNKRQMRNGAMDGGIRFSRRERVKPVS